MRPDQDKTIDLDKPPFAFDDGDPHLVATRALPASIDPRRRGLWLLSKTRPPIRLRIIAPPARGIWGVR